MLKDINEAKVNLQLLEVLIPRLEILSRSGLSTMSNEYLISSHPVKVTGVGGCLILIGQVCRYKAGRSDGKPECIGSAIYLVSRRGCTNVR